MSKIVYCWLDEIRKYNLVVLTMTLTIDLKELIQNKINCTTNRMMCRSFRCFITDMIIGVFKHRLSLV